VRWSLRIVESIQPKGIFQMALLQPLRAADICWWHASSISLKNQTCQPTVAASPFLKCVFNHPPNLLHKWACLRTPTEQHLSIPNHWKEPRWCLENDSWGQQAIRMFMGQAARSTGCICLNPKSPLATSVCVCVYVRVCMYSMYPTQLLWVYKIYTYVIIYNCMQYFM